MHYTKAVNNFRKRKKVAEAEASSVATTTNKNSTASPKIKKVAHKRAATKKSLVN